MSSAILDKNIIVLVADPSQALRRLFRQILNKQGYKNVLPFEKLKEAKKSVPKSGHYWVIAPAANVGGDSGVDFLNEIDFQAQPAFVTLTIEPTDYRHMHECFVRGMMSFIKKPVSVQGLQTELNDLFAIAANDRGFGVEIAANYFRKFFEAENQLEMIVHLERCLLEQSEPTNYGYLSLARAYIQNKEYTNALSALHLVQSPSAVESTVAKKLRSDAINLLKKDPNTSIGILNAVIIDPDESSTNQLKTYFKEFGVEGVHVFADSMKAYEFIRANPIVEIVLLEWRLKGLNAPAFIQRIRQDGLRVPLVIVSSLLNKNDLTLLSEIGVSAIVEKPMQKEIFLMNISWAIQEFRKPTEQKSLLNAIMLHLRNNAISEAEKFKSQYLNNQRIPAGKRLFVEALFDFHEGNIESACATVQESIKLLGSEALMSVNLYGKCLLKLNRFNDALACFKKASSISPANLMRLCEIADINLVLGNQEAAKETLEQAKVIDASNLSVRICEAKVAIVAGDTDFAERTLSSMESSTEVIAMMNNRAILMAKSGKINEAIEEYLKTLKAIPLSHKKERQTVNYNLSLSFVKVENLPKAAMHLELCSTGDAKLTVRSSDLLVRVKHAISTGKKLVLNQTDSDTKANEIAKGIKDKSTKISPDILQKSAKPFCLINIINSSVSINNEEAIKKSA